MGRGGRSSGQEPRAQRNPENGQASADPAYESNLSRSYTGANPYFARSSAYDDGRYTDNCANVVYAFEARMRGEDAQAAAASEAMMSSGWLNAMKNQEWEHIYGADARETLENTERIMRAQGPNARFVINIKYADGDGGHLFNAVTDSSGRPRFIEAQSGDELSRAEMLERYGISRLASTATEQRTVRRFDRATKSFVNVERTRNTVTPRISRVDNLEFDKTKRRSWDASKRKNKGY